MASTHTSLSYHIVFGTKYRESCIDEIWRPRLHEYLGGSIKGLGGLPDCIGGVADHVHMLVGLKPSHCLSDFVREMKKSSSVWVHNEIGSRQFAWQEGYSAFTVGPTGRDAVRRYIVNQDEHHRAKSFREEVVEVLT